MNIKMWQEQEIKKIKNTVQQFIDLNKSRKDIRRITNSYYSSGHMQYSSYSLRRGLRMGSSGGSTTVG